MIQPAAEGHRALGQWCGRMMVDCKDRRIGRVIDVYVDVENDSPVFATVAQGFISKRLLFVPLEGLRVSTRGLRATVTRELIKSAPDVEIHHEELSMDDEAALYRHFELPYSPSRCSGGRRLLLA